MTQTPAPDLLAPPRSPRVALGIVAGVAAAFAGAWIYCWITGQGLWGLGALVSGALIGTSMGFTGRYPSRVIGVTAAVLGVLSCFAGDVIWMLRYALLPNGTPVTMRDIFLDHRDILLVPICFHWLKLICYAVAGYAAYVGATRRWTKI